MNRRDAAIAQTRCDIEREADRARRARRLAERTSDRDVVHDREDRELENDRMRALVRAKPEQRQRVEDRYDAAEAEILNARAAAARTPEREPMPDLDGGRGDAPETPWTPSWADPGSTP